MFNSHSDIEVLKTLQTAIGLLVSTEGLGKSKGEQKKVEVYKRDKANLITCKEAAKLYPIGEHKFRELCRSTNKNFPSIKIGSRYYIVKNKLDEWLMEEAIGEVF